MVDQAGGLDKTQQVSNRETTREGVVGSDGSTVDQGGTIPNDAMKSLGARTGEGNGSVEDSLKAFFQDAKMHRPTTPRTSPCTAQGGAASSSSAEANTFPSIPPFATVSIAKGSTLLETAEVKHRRRLVLQACIMKRWKHPF